MFLLVDSKIAHGFWFFLDSFWGEMRVEEELLPSLGKSETKQFSPCCQLDSFYKQVKGTFILAEGTVFYVATALPWQGQSWAPAGLAVMET